MESTIKDTLTNLMEVFNKRMANFEDELRKSPTSPPNTTALSAEYASFKTFIVQSLSSLQQQVQMLAQNVDQMEVRGRRKMLLVHGVPETPNENTEAVLIKVLCEQLHIKECSSSDVKRCNRMGRQVNHTKPRPIIVKFQDVILRDKVWYSKTNLKGSGITISEFLTKQRHDTFMAAREKFGISKCWTKEGFIYILLPDGSRQCVSSVIEINQIKINPDAKKTTNVPKAVNVRVKRNITTKK